MHYKWNGEGIVSSSDTQIIDFKDYEIDYHYLIKQSHKVDKNDHRSLKNIFQNDGNIQKLSVEIKEKLENSFDFVIVRDLPIQELGVEAYAKFAVGMSSLIGTPTMTDRSKGIIAWPVKADPNATGSNLTFSQHNLEAEFHTDSQYYKEPERYFSLHCVCPDKFGAGVNSYVHYKAVVQKIEKRKDGENIINTLRNTQFPFRVPTIFTKSLSDKEVEVIKEPILGENIEIRYRRDTIDKAIKTGQFSLTAGQNNALKVIEEILSDKSIQFEYFLNQGEAIFANNHTLLHSRTSFTDPDRFLYRIRMKV